MKRDMTALVTGASSGIGKAYAQSLARQGYDLILVARRRELLESLGEELGSRYGIEADVLTADLTRDEEVIRVAEQIEAAADLSMLVNNAGFAVETLFAESDIERQLDMVRIHDMAAMRLTRAALPGMLARRRGYIVNLSSMGGFFPFPGNAIYNASKAFLVTFTETLQLELAGTGVHVQVLCPGFTHTGFHAAENLDVSDIPAGMWMNADEVVEESLRALQRGKVVFIPGSRNRMLALFFKLPRPLLYRGIGLLVKGAARRSSR